MRLAFLILEPSAPLTKNKSKTPKMNKNVPSRRSVIPKHLSTSSSSFSFGTQLLAVGIDGVHLKSVCCMLNAECDGQGSCKIPRVLSVKVEVCSINVHGTFFPVELSCSISVEVRQYQCYHRKCNILSVDLVVSF